MQAHVCPISPHDARIVVVDVTDKMYPCKLERLQNAKTRYARAIGTSGTAGVYTEIVIPEGAQILPQGVFHVFE